MQKVNLTSFKNKNSFRIPGLQCVAFVTINLCLYCVICNKHQKFLKSLTKKQCTLLFSLDTENKVFHCTFRVLGTQLVSHISQIPTTMLLLIQFTYWFVFVFVSIFVFVFVFDVIVGQLWAAFDEKPPRQHCFTANDPRPGLPLPVQATASQ